MKKDKEHYPAYRFVCNHAHKLTNNRLRAFSGEVNARMSGFTDHSDELIKEVTAIVRTRS